MSLDRTVKNVDVLGSHGISCPSQSTTFRSTADGIAIPYGIYDVQANRGAVFVGCSHETPEFTVASINKWLCFDGRYRYPNARDVLILADCGGGNGYRTRQFKEEQRSIHRREPAKWIGFNAFLVRSLPTRCWLASRSRP